MGRERIVSDEEVDMLVARLLMRELDGVDSMKQ